MKSSWWLLVAGVVLLAGGEPSSAEEAIRLQERFTPGSQYRVRARVELTGTLTPPAVKGKPAPKALTMQGDSALEYDERVLAVSAGQVAKTVRICRRMDFRRTVADRLQQTSLRPGVRRLVLLRRGNTEVPFSPDGPLTWGEIDQVRTDVFTPALAGLLPERPVRVGERWAASLVAVKELTDMERIQEGQLECRLEQVRPHQGRRQARVVFSGTVRGTNEDGQNRQKLQGYLDFDLESSSLSYLYLKGTHSLLDRDGKEVGHIEGRFVLVRQAPTRCPELTDEALRGVVLEPNADNTLLLYDNADLGLRFLFPRGWHVAGVRGSQVALDGPAGAGLLLTVDPLSTVPTGQAFLAESRAWLVKQKARILRVLPPQRVAGTPSLEHFALEAEMGGEKFWMDYYVVRQASGGASLAARLPPRDLEALRKQVGRLARSIALTGKVPDRK